MNVSPRSHHLGIIACHVCGWVLEHTDKQLQQCPRCHSALHDRRKHSTRRAWLFLIAALLTYIPANLLPVMNVQFIGQGEQRLTIMGGILDLWHDGAYDIAAVVFLASVALPCAKFVLLAGLLLSVQVHSRFARRQRDRLHRFLERVGYWSMLDVLVVGILGSLVQFQDLGSIEPGAGIFLFGASVVLMMLAAHSFDSRLIWDDEDIGLNTSHRANRKST